MNEAQVVRKIMQDLTGRFGKRANVFKHNDTMTAGIPDISVTACGTTHWFEVKLLSTTTPTRSEVKKKFDALQLASVMLLADNGRACYLVAIHADGERETKLGLISARSVFHYLNEGLTENEFHDMLAEAARPFKITMNTVAERIQSCRTDMSIA